jgi:hypothetical protein
MNNLVLAAAATVKVPNESLLTNAPYSVSTPGGPRSSFTGAARDSRANCRMRAPWPPPHLTRPRWETLTIRKLDKCADCRLANPYPSQ